MKLYYDPDTKTILDNESKGLAPVADLSDSALIDSRDVDALALGMAAGDSYPRQRKPKPKTPAQTKKARTRKASHKARIKSRKA